MFEMSLWNKKTVATSRLILSPDEISVSGERYHKQTIEHLILTHGQGKLHWRTTAHLSPDHHNEVDKHAVQILVEGQRVGYIHRDHCEKVWRLIGPHGIILECSIRWNGQPSNGVYDVKLFPLLWS